MSKEPREGFEVARYVCAGKVELVGGKLGVKLYRIPGNGERVDKAVLFDAKKTHLNPGQVYDIEGKDHAGENTSLVLTSARWVGEWPNRVERDEWQAADLARRRAAEAKALEKREGGPTTGLDRPLRALRAAYVDLPANQRVAFEVWVLSQLRGVR